MKLGERVRTSWNVLTRGGTFPMQRKAERRSVLLWPKWREAGAQWAMTDMTAYIEEGFNLNAVIYSAIMYKVRAAASAPLMAYLGERAHKEPAPPGHPLTRLLDRPNPYQSFLELDNEIRVFFNLFGNAYVWFKRAGKGYPTEMRALRPDCVRHMYQDGELRGYLFIPVGGTPDDGIKLLAQDVMHVRMPNPGDPFAGAGKGLSPLSALAHSADVDNAATAYLKQFFDYGAMPPGLLSFDVPMEDSDVAAARNRWMEVYGGSHNWTDVAVMDQGGKYQRLGLTFAELDMAGLDARNESRMAMCFGVPLTLIESRPALVQSTYSNKEQDRQMFWEDTMIPELRMFEVEWLYYLSGPDGAFPAYDLGNVPALQKARNERTQMLIDSAKGALVTRAEVKEALGLPYTEADNVYLVPIGLMTQSAEIIDVTPVTSPSNEGDRANATDEEGQRSKALPAPQNKKRALTSEEKARVWKQIDATAASYEGVAADAARAAFEHDRREVRAIVNASKKSALAAKATVAWMDVLLPVLEYYRMASPETWRKQFAPVFEAIVMSQGKQLNATFGMTFDVRNLMGEDWYRSYELVFADPLADTSMKGMRDLFGVAFAEGASVPDMERSLDVLFKQWVDGDVSDAERERSLFAEARLPQYRLETIARTETMRMSNAGANALYKDWGVHKKEWLATLGDNRTRPSHLAANGQVVSIDQRFDVGGYSLMQPGDPAGPLEETINCRCTVLPVIE